MPSPSRPSASRNPTLGVLAFYSVLVTGALLLLLIRGPSPSDLTRAEAQRDVDRLAGLVRHTRVVAPGHDGPVHVTWSPAPGGYRGLALIPQWRRDAADAGPEVHLAVRLTIDLPAFLRNPARLPLPSATLHREPPASDLVDPRHPRRLSLALDPADGGDAALAVAVDNVLGPSGRAAATAVGRSWAGLAAPGPPRLPPWDQRILAVLTRTLRGRICDDLEVWSSCRDTALTVTRDHRRATYRVTLMDRSEAREALPFELRVTVGGDRPLEGTLRPLAGASLTRPADLFVLPPRGSLDVVTPGEPGLVIARWRPGHPAWGESRWRIDFRTLLEDTQW